MKASVKKFIFAGFAATITVLAITIATYAAFFHEFLGQFLELSPEIIEIISRNPVNVCTMLIANLAHGFLMATVIKWGGFYKPSDGAKAAAIIAFLTEIYFCFSQYSIMKTMSLVSAIVDTIMWTVINLAVGAVTAKILGSEK